MPELLWPIAIAALLLILVVLYICGRLASHEVQVGKILGVHRRSRLNQLYHEPTSSDQQAPNALETRITHLSFQNWRGFHGPRGMGNVALDVSFKKGDKVWIQGESGSGKYTLLAAIAGDCLFSGNAKINGQYCDRFRYPIGLKAYQAH